MKIIGHRGAKGLAPENTVASFLKALAHNADEIECDVRLTAERVLVLSHNRFISDSSGNKLVVAEHNYLELKAHKPDLTTLQEAILSVNKQRPLLIEVKSSDVIQPLIKLLKQRLRGGWQASDFRLASFHFKTLRALADALPEIQLVVNDRWSGVRATSRGRRLGTRRLAMNRLWLWSGFIAALSRGGWELYAYTVNDRRLAKRWAKSGLKGIVTDFPDKFDAKWDNNKHEGGF
ncbi:MAG TPA: glycerophosphodiester phosphodiesterase [Candidatus Dormibacteraeota bacterium]|nr:glycerophosphodiester phosphodiesterase [Candidatus Dormibacteraeota bacterium]